MVQDSGFFHVPADLITEGRTWFNTSGEEDEVCRSAMVKLAGQLFILLLEPFSNVCCRLFVSIGDLHFDLFDKSNGRQGTSRNFTDANCFRSSGFEIEKGEYLLEVCGF